MHGVAARVAESEAGTERMKLGGRKQGRGWRPAFVDATPKVFAGGVAGGVSVVI